MKEPKDFGMINEGSHATDILLSAWKVNEYMPYHIVNNISLYCDLYRKKISILGYTFKKNSDDTRDTLVPKLIRYIERKVPDSITICEPHLDTKTIQGYPNKTLEEALSNADIVFIAMNHDLFSNVDGIYKFIKDGAWIESDSKGNYINGIKDGTWTYWYSTGKDRKEEIYEDGVLIEKKFL